MKFRPFVIVALAGAAALAACKEDLEGFGVPFRIQTNATVREVAVGTKFTITAYTIDRNNRRIPGPLEATVPAGVTADSTVYVRELSETRFFLTANAPIAEPGGPMVISGHNLVDTTFIIVE